MLLDNTLLFPMEFVGIHLEAGEIEYGATRTSIYV